MFSLLNKKSKRITSPKRTEHMFALCSCITIKDVVSRESNGFKRNTYSFCFLLTFQGGVSVAVLCLCVVVAHMVFVLFVHRWLFILRCFVCAWADAYKAFVLFVHRLLLIWRLFCLCIGGYLWILIFRLFCLCVGGCLYGICFVCA